MWIVSSVRSGPLGTSCARASGALVVSPFVFAARSGNSRSLAKAQSSSNCCRACPAISPERRTASLSAEKRVPRLSATPGGSEWIGPALGEHTDAVLRALGYAPARIEALRQAGAI